MSVRSWGLGLAVWPLVPLLAALLPPGGDASAVGAIDPVFVSREPAAVPARYAAPLPVRLDLSGMTTTERLLSLGGHNFPRNAHVSRQICRGDPSMRERFLAGLRRIDTEPDSGIATAYWWATFGCYGERQCSWFRSRIDLEESPEVRGFLWRRVTVCWPLDDPQLFERHDAPDDEVVSYHEQRRRRRPERVHSDRLAGIVRRRVERGEEAPLRDAVSAYAFMDHPKTAATLLDLHTRTDSPEMRRILVYGMANQSDPQAHRLFTDTCRRYLAERMERWRASGSWPRASPRRWGDPCTGTFREHGKQRLTPPRADGPMGPPVPRDRLLGIEGRVSRFIDIMSTQFTEQARLLRQFADLVQPDLDGVIFEETWPAADSVPLQQGPHAVQIFVNGDGVTFHAADRAGKPDLEQAQRIKDRLESALRETRLIDAYWKGERFRFRYQPRGDRNDYFDAEAMIEIANTLLEATGSEKRIAWVESPGEIAVLVATAAEIERAVALGLLESEPLAPRKVKTQNRPDGGDL